MDKPPKLLEDIQLNHPSTSLKTILELANREYFRQIEESISGMLNKKSHSQLIEVIGYIGREFNRREKEDAIKIGKEQESNKQEHRDGSESKEGGRLQSKEGSRDSIGDCLQQGRKK